MLFPRLAALALVVHALVFVPGCVAGEEDGPSAEELAELDSWAATADGKADMPSSFTEVIAWLRDVYTNQMSAIWNNQAHPASATAALAEIRTRAQRAGVDPTRALYRTTVQRLDAGEIDHSEIDITVPGGTIVRLVGDPKGAGAFFDRTRFHTTVGPQLCLTWAELQTAIATAYQPGAYGASFVCHTITERVLRAIDVGTAPYSGKFRTYQAARWVWGPIEPSFNSQNPASWDVSRSCTP